MPRAILCLLILLPLHLAHAGHPMPISMVAAEWQIDGKTEFSQREGLAQGLLEINDGIAILRKIDFRDGTIEFDIRPLADDMPGIQFRRENADSMEILYLRPSPECPIAQDCVQYVPRVHGVMPWEMYPQFQTAAPVSERGWSHIKLVISGQRMNLFINRPASPTMQIGRLEGDARAGAIALVGPAAFANLVVAPGVVDGLSAEPAPDPAANDPGLVRHWQVSTPAAHDLRPTPVLVDMPAGAASWHPITAEAFGLVNLSRLYGSPTDKNTGALVWLKTNIHAERARTVRVSLGYLHEATIFANGKAVFAGENMYVAGTPKGRIGPENASFDLPLVQGDNEIAIALNNILAVGHNHYGWGLTFRVQDPSGLTFPEGVAAAAH